MKTDNRLLTEKIAFTVLRALTVFAVLILVVILYFIFSNGWSKISWEFLTEMPTGGMMKGGIYPAIVGTVYLVALSIIIAAPIGVLSAIYLVEYAKQGILTKIIRNATNNLAGVPSVVFGLFGMALFVKFFDFGASILSGSLTLALVVLPVIIRSTEESLMSVPQEYRHASLALGASQWQTITKVTLPAAFPSIITGIILSIGRVAGETAPILFTVAAYYLPQLPTSVFDQTMALPYHLYVIATSGTNLIEARPIAYGTAIVLLVLVLLFNMVAIILRNHFRKKLKSN